MANQLEDSVKAALERQGCEVLRNGWPDFMVLTNRHGHSNGERTHGFALEVKSNGDKLREDQEKMHAALRLFGLPVLVARQDFEAVIRKKGRALLTPKTKSHLEFELASLKREMAALNAKWNEVAADLGLLQCIFDDPVGVDAKRIVEPLKESARNYYTAHKPECQTQHREFWGKRLPNCTCPMEYEI